MTRTIVLGAGVVGSAAAHDLVSRRHQVTVADVDRAAAEAVGEESGATAVALDVEDGAAVRALMADHDAVVSAVPYRFGVEIAQAAIDSHTLCVDFGGNPAIVARQLELDEAARSAGVLIVPDCGLAPGLANVMAKYLIDTAPDPVDSVQIRVGALPQHPQEPIGYQLAFSPLGLINEYAEPVEIIEDGVYTTVEPLTRFEVVTWDRWGPLEAFSTAGGASTMPKDFQGRVQTLEYKTLRYPGHGRVFAGMRAIGLFDDTGSPSPRRVLIDALAKSLPSGGPDLVLVRVTVDSGGTRRILEIEDVHDGRFSALARTTAFPATALVDMVTRGTIEEPGVRTMVNAVDGRSLIDDLAPSGITVVNRGPSLV